MNQLGIDAAGGSMSVPPLGNHYQLITWPDRPLAIIDDIKRGVTLGNTRIVIRLMVFQALAIVTGNIRLEKA